MGTMKIVISGIVATCLVIFSAIAFHSNAEAKAPRSCDCACDELRRIRLLLENQFQVTCNERRCLPVPTPTGAPDGGPLE